MRQTQKTEVEAITALLDGICGRTLKDAAVLPLILCNDKRWVDNLQLLDFLRQSVLTSLQFGQYRRAVWYLQAFSRMCEKTFGKDSRETVMQTLQKRIGP